MKDHQYVFHRYAANNSFIRQWGLLLIACCLFSACFKNLPDKQVIYFNDFETSQKNNIAIYGTSGLIDSLKISSFNQSKVLGRFNSNYILLQLDMLPVHNAVKIEFDLYIHDKWDGNYVPPGATYPDLWQMTLNSYPIYLTSFSNGTYNQSFPDNYTAGITGHKAFSNSWATLQGVCTSAGITNGTAYYKIEYTTAHQGSLQLAINDVPNPVNSLCLKSWSLDNLRITAITYK